MKKTYLKNITIQHYIQSHLTEFTSLFSAKVGKWNTNQFFLFVLGNVTSHYLEEFDAARIARITEKAMTANNLTFLLELS